MTQAGRQLLVGLAAGVAAVFLSMLPPAEHLELKGYDFLHSLRGNRATPAEFVLVTIDEPSFAETGLQWPWPRSLHGRLIEALSRYGAGVIALDIVFAEASLPAEDEALARALRASGRVVLASDIESSVQSGYDREMLVEPLGLFASGARTGITKVALDRDNVVRRFYPTKAGEKLFAEQIAAAAGKGGQVPPGSFISFRYPPDTFKKVSYYQALEPEQFLPPDFFRGKIVIVGKSVSNATGATSDFFATPFMQGGHLMSGVELQAVMAENVISSRFVERAGVPVRLAILLALALAGALLQRNWRPVRAAVVTLSALLLYLILVVVSFERYAYWVPTFAALPPLLLPYGYAMGEAYIRSEQKRREIRRIFGHYLSPVVLECILAAPDKLKLGGTNVEATVLFSDIAGFTTHTEAMQPEAVAGMLNLYFNAMAKEVFAEQGTIDKFIGDAVMAFWGAPLPDPEHPLRACRAAIAMGRALERLNPELVAKGYPSLSARIGINTGKVIAGNIGSEDLFNYTVLGDAVNLASRLEGANKEFGTSVIISEYVYETIRDLVEVRPLGRIRVKGKSEDVAVYELIACK
ncbi:MAG: CHASE2 domain-containing protein [Thermodesulfovibrionales bacterium]